MSPNVKTVTDRQFEPDELWLRGPWLQYQHCDVTEKMRALCLDQSYCSHTGSCGPWEGCRTMLYTVKRTGRGHTEARRGAPSPRAGRPAMCLSRPLDGSQSFSMYSHTLDALRGNPPRGTGCPAQPLDPKDVQWLDRLTQDRAVGILQGFPSWCSGSAADVQ